MIKFITCIIVITVLVFVEYILYHLFSTLFIITGISKEKARTQTISLLTMTGYTTKESEIIVNYRLRRKIANACMISGYVMTALISGLVIGAIVSLDFSNNGEQFLATGLIALAITIATIILLIVITRISKLRKFFAHILEKMIFGKGISDEKTTIVFGDKSFEKAYATIYLNKVPDILVGKKISNINFKAVGISVLTVILPDGNGTDNVDDVTLEKGLKIDVFGEPETIKLIFKKQERE